jgi:hypothetical protein
MSDFPNRVTPSGTPNSSDPETTSSDPETNTVEVLPAPKPTPIVGYTPPRGKHLWQKGAPSPNPRGRPKSGFAFSEAVRKKLDDRAMDELLETALSIALGEPVVRDVEWLRAKAKARAEGKPAPPTPKSSELIFPTVVEILKAWDLLVSWGFRKPPVAVEASIQEAPAIDLSKLPDDVLASLEAAGQAQLEAANREEEPEPKPEIPVEALAIGPSLFRKG